MIPSGCGPAVRLAVEALDVGTRAALRHMGRRAESAGCGDVALALADLSQSWTVAVGRFQAETEAAESPGLVSAAVRLAALRESYVRSADPADGRAHCVACSTLQVDRARLCPTLGCSLVATAPTAVQAGRSGADGTSARPEDARPSCDGVGGD